MRKGLKEQEVGLDPNFNYRGKNQTRIETFSDAVFALAITLIVLSSTVPESLSELLFSMRSILPFGICVVLIVVIWYQHYIFFVRYGLQSVDTVVVNTILLFLVLVYVYPLKFLMGYLFELYVAMFSGDWQLFISLYGDDLSYQGISKLMMFYGAGAGLIFLCLAWLYRLALKRQEALHLSDYEVFMTKSSLIVNVCLGIIPMLSFLIALCFGWSFTGTVVSGYIYFLYPVLMPLVGRWVDKRKKRILEEL